ncbi:unnamed protein product [Amoebophrya sp. A120]|nr:unnamed protein product [Amoebophrya sp. A120]|eukprot:GSA120T00025196001.1
MTIMKSPTGALLLPLPATLLLLISHLEHTALSISVVNQQSDRKVEKKKKLTLVGPNVAQNKAAQGKTSSSSTPSSGADVVQDEKAADHGHAPTGAGAFLHLNQKNTESSKSSQTSAAAAAAASKAKAVAQQEKQKHQESPTSKNRGGTRDKIKKQQHAKNDDKSRSAENNKRNQDETGTWCLLLVLVLAIVFAAVGGVIYSTMKKERDAEAAMPFTVHRDAKGMMPSIPTSGRRKLLNNRAKPEPSEAGPESEASPDAGTTSETSSKSKSSSQTPKEDGGTGHHRGHHHRDKTSKGEAVHVPGVIVTREWYERIVPDSQDHSAFAGYAKDHAYETLKNMGFKEPFLGKLALYVQSNRTHGKKDYVPDYNHHDNSEAPGLFKKMGMKTNPTVGQVRAWCCAEWWSAETKRQKEQKKEKKDKLVEAQQELSPEKKREKEKKEQEKKDEKNKAKEEIREKIKQEKNRT